MKNKIVYRKELVKNQFTSIHTSILNDTRLSSNAFRLLTSILSDNDETFNLSQTVYCNRLGWNNKTFQRAIDDLIECGYIRRTEISNDKHIPGVKKAGSTKKIYFYTVSEYGNLNSKKKIQEPIKGLKIYDENILTKEYITNSIEKFIIDETPTRVSDERITEMLDERSNGLTQEAYKAVLSKIINRVKDNPSMTEHQIAGKILAFKTEYRKPVMGNQD